MPTLQVLKVNSTGQQVQDWQNFLIGQGFDPGIADGIFGENTKRATVQFQIKAGLQPDGTVGNKTFGAAMQLGFEGVTDIDISTQSANFPPKPAFPPLTGTAAREAIFEHFDFVHQPVQGNPENIRILGDWESRNIVLLHVPQLIAIKGNDRATFHRLAANQFLKLWSDWGAAGLLSRIFTWDGSFVPRFQRGTTILSNHAFGSAFDINAAFNPLGVLPPLVGQKGSVRELVEIANENGFYWGGHFNSRKDGMHFEIAELM